MLNAVTADSKLADQQMPPTLRSSNEIFLLSCMMVAFMWGNHNCMDDDYNNYKPVR